MHVINFESGGSESHVNAPEPGTFALLALAFAVLATRQRRSWSPSTGEGLRSVYSRGSPGGSPRR